MNHILLVKVNGGKNLVLYTISKWDSHSFIRFLFPETCLYLIIFGIDAVGLFIHEFRRSMTYFYYFFFLCWFINILHAYQHTGSLELESNSINFMFIVFSALAGSLIKNLQLLGKW